MFLRTLTFAGAMSLALLATLLLTSCRVMKDPVPDATATPEISAVDANSPSLSLKSLQDGKTVSLADFHGRVVLLDFWATWCPPCRASLPHTQALSQSDDVKSGKLAVLAVNLREDPATIRSFMERNKFSFPVLLDPAGTSLEQFNADGIPTFVIIGRNGQVAWQQTGFNEERLSRALQDALGK